MQPIAQRCLCRVASVACAVLLLGLCAATRFAAQSVVPDSQPVRGMQLELRRSDAQQAGLRALLQAQQTPGAPEYHHWLTPEQFAARFAPDGTVQQAAAAWLERQGFQVDGTARNGMRVTFSGTAVQVRRAFAVGLQATGPLDEARLRVSATAATQLPGGLPVRALYLPGGVKETRNILAAAVDANTDASVVIPVPAADAPAEEWTELLDEAAAQGLTVLQVNGDGADGGSAAVLATAPNAALPTDTAASRPDWQAAPGLPADGLRAVPDAVLGNTAALAAGLNSLAVKHGRVGALAPQLYRLATGHGIFTHADGTATAGSWTASDGLGAIHVKALLAALATGTTGVNVALAVSSYTITHGQSLGLTYTVTGGGGTPSGTVTATLKGRSGATVTLGPAMLDASGVATLSTATLPGDVYDISGTYSGDANFAPGTSNTVTSTVNPEAVKLSASAPATALGANIPVTVIATSTSGVGVPTGAVTVLAYFAATPTTFTGTLSSSGAGGASTVIEIPATAVGPITLQASCTGNASFACSQPTSFAATVTQATPTVSLTSTPEAPAVNSATQKYDLAVAVAAPSGSAAAGPTGSVVIQNNGTAIATVPLTKGAGTYTVSLSGTGNSLVAVYGGDPNYVAASSPAVVVNATLLSTATSLTVSPATASFGSALSLTATVTPSAYAASGAPTGTITFRSSVQGVVGMATLANGYVTFNTAALQAGTHTLTANYAGDANYSASVSGAITVTVSPGKVATTTTVSAGSAPSLAGQNTVLTVTVAPSFAAIAQLVTPNLTCTGQVTLFANGKLLANGSTSGGALIVTAKLSAGNNILTAMYNGDAQCYGSTSAASVVPTALVASALTLQPSVSYANAGNTIQLTATASAASAGIQGLPSGAVTFYDMRGGVQVALGTAPLAASGTGTSVATINVNGSIAGQHSFSALYGGDTTFTSASSAPASVSFGDFSLALNAPSLSMVQGGSASAVATVTAVSGFVAPVALTCTSPGGTLISCGFSPAVVEPGKTSQLVVTTATQSSRAMRTPGATVLEGTGATVAVLLLLPFRRSRRLGRLLMLACCMGLIVGGCGLGRVDPTNNLNGGGSSGGSGGTGTPVTGTPLGTQLLTITASSSDGSLRHTYTYAVTVQ